MIDLIEEKEHRMVPLRQYLEFGLNSMLSIEMPRWVEELLVNRYYANGYTDQDAVTAYIYLTGIVAVIYAVRFELVLEFFLSFVPDEEISTFNAFVDHVKKQDNDAWWDG